MTANRFTASDPLTNICLVHDRDACAITLGVRFSELYNGADDLTRFVRTRVAQGSIAALNAFDEREAEQGARFHYASSETVALTVLLRADIVWAMLSAQRQTRTGQ